MTLTRRNLISRLPVFLAAPAIIRVADLMPVKAETKLELFGCFDELNSFKELDPLDRFYTKTNPPWLMGQDGGYPCITNHPTWFRDWLRMHPNAVPAGD